MADNELKIVIDANIDAAVKALDAFAKEVGVSMKEGVGAVSLFEAKLEELEKQLKTTSGKELVELTANINKLKSGISAIKGGQFEKIMPAEPVKKFNAAVANATPTLTNFGRIVSDAPYGLIGISNNIDPLLQSFSSLQKQTGSATGAFKALGKELLGPAGIAFGVTAVTSILVAFGPAIVNAITHVTEFDKAAREAAGGGAKAFVEAGREFMQFVDTASNMGNSIDRQKDALNDANKALGEYGLAIKSVNDLQKVGGQISAFYAQIKQEEAREVIFAKKAAEEYAKSIEEGIALQQGDMLGAMGKQGFIQNIKTLFSGANAVSTVIQNYGDNVTESKNKQAQFTEEADKSRKKINELIEIMKLMDGVTEKFDGPKDKVKQMSDIVDKLKVDLNNLTSGDDVFSKIDKEAADALLQLNRLKKDGKITVKDFIQAQGIIDEIKRIKTELAQQEALDKFRDGMAKLGQETKVSTELLAALNRLDLSQAKSQIDTVANAWRGVFEMPKAPAGTSGMPKDIQDRLAAFNASLAAQKDKVKAFSDEVSAIIRQSLSSAAVAVGEGIGNMISGTGNLFDGLFSVISGAMRQLGEAMIAMAFAAIKLENLIISPQTALIAGIGLVALSQVVKNFTGPKFADGGIVTGPTVGMIGEAGPEVIFPLDRLNEFMQPGAGQTVRVEGVISGQTLRLIQQRADNQFRRNNG